MLMIWLLHVELCNMSVLEEIVRSYGAKMISMELRLIAALMLMTFQSKFHMLSLQHLKSHQSITLMYMKKSLKK